MNEFIANNTDLLYCSAILLLLILSCLHGYKSRRDIKYSQKKVELLEENMQALCSGASGIDAMITNVNRRIDRLMQRQEAIDFRADSGSRGYNSAIRMIKRGATVSELVENCGITGAEAKLLHSMHAVSDTEKLFQ